MCELIKRMKTFITILFLILGFNVAQAQTTNPKLLVNIPSASQSEIDAYNAADLEIGMLVYNTDLNCIFLYTDSGFQKMLSGESTYTGHFIITATGEQIITGLPFKPSAITTTAKANIETISIDSDNGVGNNNNGVPNTFGSMNGYARQDGVNIIQQCMFSGGSGASINDISRYSSDANFVGLRYANNNGDSVGKTTANLTSFEDDGFKINVSEKADNVVVIFTAYR